MSKVQSSISYVYTWKDFGKSTHDVNFRVKRLYDVGQVFWHGQYWAKSLYISSISNNQTQKCIRKYVCKDNLLKRFGWLTNKVFVALVVCLHARLYSRLSSPIVNVSQRPSQIKGNTSPAFCFLKKRFAISDAKINIHIGEQLLLLPNA